MVHPYPSLSRNHRRHKILNKRINSIVSLVNSPLSSLPSLDIQLTLWNLPSTVISTTLISPLMIAILYYEIFTTHCCFKYTCHLHSFTLLKNSSLLIPSLPLVFKPQVNSLFNFLLANINKKLIGWFLTNKIIIL